MKEQVHRRHRKHLRMSPGLWIAFVVIGIYSLTLLMPLYYMLNNSFKRIDDFLENGPWSFPVRFWGQNYADAIKLSSGHVTFAGMYVNSIILTVGSVLIMTAAAAVTAYALAKFKFFGRDFLVAVGIGALVIPDLGSSTVVYKMFVDLNMIDTWFILVKYSAPFGMQFLILYSYFRTISPAYVEAARLDGAGEWRIFLQICLPMAKGALGATMTILAINSWNDYYTPYMYLPSVKTLSVGLQELSLTISQLDRPKLFAGMVVAVLPLIIVFISMRKVIIENTTTGGIKG